VTRAPLYPEQVVEPVVGRWYMRPAVYGDMYYAKRWWPVTGPLHEDHEHVKFEWIHYHIDWRFVPKREFNLLALGPTYGNGHCYARVLQQNPRINEGGFGKPELRRFKCIRPLPPYPFKAAVWLDALEKEYADCKLKPGMVCPHRGIPLADLPQKHGIVTCPGHGLSWYARTGELVSHEAMRKLP
jgi:hypothetical protein